MNKWFWTFFILFLIFHNSGESVYGLDPQEPLDYYQHYAWSVNEGLPQNSVRAIAQTRDGYLWLGTQEGLVRFNGFDFELYDQANTKELKTSHITSLYEDSTGCLWIGTWGGGVCCLRNGHFTTHTIQNGLVNNIVRSIEGDNRGNIWIGTWGGGLSKFRDNQFIHYTQKDGLTSQYIFTVFSDPDGSLWIGTWGGGLNHFKNGKFTCYTTDHGLDNNGVMSITKDHNGILWIGTEGGGLNRLEDGKITVYNSQHGLFGHQVLSIHEDCDQNLWIGTWGGGLYRYKNGKFNAFTTKQGLTSNIVRVITQDREKNLWIGTSGAGLNRLKNRRFFTYTTKHGLSNNVIRTVFQAKNGKLWIGTDGGGLNSFWEGRFSVFSTDNGLSNNVVRSILEDRQGNLWIGTYGGGLNKFFRGKFTTYTTEEGLSGNYILSLVEDRAGNIWAGTWGDGLNRIRDGKISIITMKKGLSNDNVMVLHEDRQGKLWIGTGGGGLNCWENGNFVIYTTRQGLAGNYILAIYEDNEGTLWIGTYNNGLSRFKAGQFTSYSSKDGLYNDTVFQILEDDRENLWMSCSKGIFRISKKELNQFATGKRRSINSFFYNQSDGMESCECNGSGQPSGIKSKDGALWFPTVKGVVTINPSQVQSNTITPPVVIERIKIDEKFIDPKKVKEFSPGKKIFEFHYTALSYTSPQKIRFRYKLDPFNQKWVDAGSRRIAYYTNIPAGEYRFNVIACNSDGVWNTTGASFKFVYKPYFYQTFWFYLLAVIMVVAGTITIHLFRIRQIIIRERRKYEKSRVPVEDAEKYLTKLIQFMETQKSYLDPGINLHRLSKKLMIPDHYISQIINTKLKQNFFDFINSYRIEEAKRRISSSDFQNMSFLQIAFDVGFNSKSAFNRAFKKHTAMTPSEYKKIINHTK